MYGTPEDVMSLTGITPEQIGLEDETDPAAELKKILTDWLIRISAAIDVRIGSTVTAGDMRYNGLVDICVRTTAQLAAQAIQQRSNPLVQTGDYQVSVMNTAEVTRHLDRELVPYMSTKKPRSGSVHVFSSISY